MKRILIVEDEPGLLRLLEYLLKENGYRTILAEDGESALEVFRRGEKVDLVLLDLLTPRLPGWDLLKKMESLFPKGEGPHVIVLSAVSRHESRREMEEIRYPVDFYMEKPFSLDELLNSIQTVLSHNNHHKR